MSKPTVAQVQVQLLDRLLELILGHELPDIWEVRHGRVASYFDHDPTEDMVNWVGEVKKLSATEVVRRAVAFYKNMGVEL